MREGHLPLIGAELKLNKGLGGAPRPHPDGKPWTKCCVGPPRFETNNSCQCFMRKPPNSGESRCEWIERTCGDETGIISARAEGGRFFCIHREDEGYHRICAGWAAKFGDKP